MSSFDFKIVPAEGLIQDYFLRSFKSTNEGEFIDFQMIKKGKLLLSFTFLVSDEKAESLPMAPFGGIWATGEIDQPELLGLFLGNLLEYLSQKGIRGIQLTQPPRVYEPLADLIANQLYKCGFLVKAIYSHQLLNGKKNIRNFLKTHSQKWEGKLAAKQLHLSIGQIKNFNFLADIQKWNSQKGYVQTWDEAQLIRQVSLFPDRYFQIMLSHQQIPQAHAVGVKLTKRVLYYFLSANNPGSPFKNLGELLLFGLVKLGKEEKVEAIDLGSSEVNGEINSNLMYFKSRFSNEIANKLTWEIQL